MTLRPTRNSLFLVGFFTVIGFLTSCDNAPDAMSISGQTMGTTYHVKVSSRVDSGAHQTLEKNINQVLIEVNNTFSTYLPLSVISRFNSSRSTQWQSMPVEFTDVLSVALNIANQTSGLYDITVGPLVNLWGFGPTFTEDNIPAINEINAARQRVGFKKILIQHGTQSVKKTNPSLYLDFSSIAKGYGVDRVSALLDSKGYTDYMVEIGGELRVKGNNTKGQPWKIAIEKPDASTRAIQRILSLTDIALATSGDYRNFFETKGVRYSHTINPLTGWPVKHDLISVTVLADSSMKADAWATALLATGSKKGYPLAVNNNLSVLFISKQNGRLVEIMTPNFKKIIQETP